MQSEKCPIKGFEEITIEYPGYDDWTVSLNELFWAGYREGGDKTSHSTSLLYGCVAVSTLAGVDRPVKDWPLQLLNWIVDTVYYNSLQKALNPEKNSSAPPQTTPND